MNLHNSRLFTVEEVAKLKYSGRTIHPKYSLLGIEYVIREIEDFFAGIEEVNESAAKEVLLRNQMDLRIGIVYAQDWLFSLQFQGVDQSLGFRFVTEFLQLLHKKNAARIVKNIEQNFQDEEVRQMLADGDISNLPNDIASSHKFRILLLRLTHSETEYWDMAYKSSWPEPKKQMRTQHKLYFGDNPKTNLETIVKNVKQLLPTLPPKAAKKAQYFIDTEQWKDQDINA